MLVPSPFYGLYKDSKRKCKKIAALVHKGTPLSEAIGTECLDTNENPGYFILFGPVPRYGNQSHFHFFILLRELITFHIPNLPSPVLMKNWFEHCIKTDWGILCLISDASMIASNNTEWQIEIVKQLRLRWDSIAIKNGPRFAGLNSDKYLWQMADSSLFVFLVNSGIPKEEFASEKFLKFDKDSIPDLIDKYVL